MKKKRLTQYELEMKHTRSIFGFFALSVLLDALILFLGFWDMTEGLFWGMYALYTIVLSPIITMGVTYLACLITRKDYETREKLVFFRIGRLVVLAVMNFNGLVINPNWSTSEGERSFFIAFVFMVVLGVIGAIVPLFSNISNLLSPKICSSVKKVKSLINTSPYRFFIFYYYIFLILFLNVCAENS